MFRTLLPALFTAIVLLAGCNSQAADPELQPAMAPVPEGAKSAIFAGGCFWCVESDFDKLDGVLQTTSGYSGGKGVEPTYQNHSGHREVVRIDYDPSKVSYEELVHYFFRTVDPLDGGGQFCDRGHEYTTAIYVADDAERAIAEREKARAEEALTREVVTPIETAGTFWPAENYHQDYANKNPARYQYYRVGCGRDRKVERRWGAEAHGGTAPKTQ